LSIALILTIASSCDIVFAQQSLQRNLQAVPVQLPGAATTLYEASYALVIGAANYRNGWGRLPGVYDDVKAVSALLTQQGFQVQQVLDPTRDQLDQALRIFVAQRGLREGDRLLVYFAGHGHTLTTAQGRKLGYIVPVDAPSPVKDAAGFRAAAYSMELIETHARQMESRHALFIFDSCFSGTIFKTRSSGFPDAITERTSKPVRQFITAGDENQTVPDYSIFRRRLERGLGADAEADLNADGYITATELGEYLHDSVTNESRRAQTPRHGKIRDGELDRGDFVFARIKLAEREEARILQRTPVTVTSAPATAGSTLKDCDVCPELVVLPKGSFTMGSREHELGRYNGDPEAEGWFENSRPQRPVAIHRTLAVGRYEISQGEWQAVMGSNPSKFKECGARCPVENVSWGDAKEYLRKLNERTGSRYGYRLLSEAEWEYAARAGCSSAFSIDGHCKDQITTHEANFNGNDIDNGKSPGQRRRKTTSVGSLNAANAWGLHDMHGNVWEWVEDCWADSLDGMPSDGAARTNNCTDARYRVLRGGSFENDEWHVRVAFRFMNSSQARSDSYGFRVVRTMAF